MSGLESRVGQQGGSPASSRYSGGRTAPQSTREPSPGGAHTPSRPRPVPDTKMGLTKEGVGRVCPQRGTARQNSARTGGSPRHLRGSCWLLCSSGRSPPPPGSTPLPPSEVPVPTQLRPGPQRQSVRSGLGASRTSRGAAREPAWAAACRGTGLCHWVVPPARGAGQDGLRRL